MHIIVTVNECERLTLLKDKSNYESIHSIIDIESRLIIDELLFYLFERLFTNFTEWNCEIRVGSGVDPILFNPKTLTWRVPTMFMVILSNNQE
jgi:hypothetical protein